MKKTLFLFISVFMFIFLAVSVTSASAAEINSYGSGTTKYETIYPQTNIDLPEAYSSVDYGYVSSMKAQTGSTCWGYSALATFESLLLKNNLFTVDLDMNHLDLWATPRLNGDGWQRSTSSAGFGYIAMGYLTSWSGPVTTEGNKINIGATSLRYLNKNNPIEIKKAIMKNGAVVGDYNSLSDGNSNNNTSFCLTQSSLSISGHSISVVGWDDNYSKDNFSGKYKPKNNGAWLCKNSWGNYNSLGGYFWISYEDYYFMNSDIFSTGYTVENYHIIDENDNIYQNEEFGATYEFNYIFNNNLTYFSVFDFSEKGNILDKVLFETTSIGADFTVYYVPVKNNIPVDDKKQWYKIDSGTVDYRGYICCDFIDMVVSQSKGAIAVEIDTNNINKGISFNDDSYVKNGIGVCEWLKNNNQLIFTQQSEVGECFVTYNGNIIDLTDFYKNMNDPVGGTFVIKAITTDTADTTILGDINFDQRININDVTYLQRYLVSYIDSLMEHQEINADFNGDGTLDVRDATAIQKYLVKK